MRFVVVQMPTVQVYVPRLPVSSKATALLAQPPFHVTLLALSLYARDQGRVHGALDRLHPGVPVLLAASLELGAETGI